MGNFIAIKVEDAALRAGLARLTVQLQDASNIMRALSEIMIDASARAFLKCADPATGNPWRPLSKARNGQREKKGRSINNILQDSGLLASSIASPGSPGSVREIGPDYALVGTNVVYAAIHQLGGKTRAHRIVPRFRKALNIPGVGPRKSVEHPGSVIPARPFLGVSERDVATMRAVVERHLRKALDGGA